MKILVLSDSHSSLRFMRECMDRIKPDAMLHLGDYYDDAATVAAEYPGVHCYQVPGNCDQHRLSVLRREVLTPVLGGVRFYMTHGHRQGVKSGIGRLLREAREEKAQVALYGHTHVADCHQEEDGLWVLNPGSSGFAGSAGLIKAENGEIRDISLLRRSDVEAFL